jgi:GNAT superfamily N-acetyltransferase
MTIRVATAADVDLLAELGARTFRETFGADNTPGDMATYIARSFTAEVIARELADSDNTYLIAEVDGHASGYAKLRLTDAPPAVVAARPIKLSRIYVLALWLGQGIGHALMQRCLDEAIASQRDAIWLGVWERNERAIAFYLKWGFTHVDDEEFVLGSDRQNDWIMSRTV